METINIENLKIEILVLNGNLENGYGIMQYEGQNHEGGYAVEFVDGEYNGEGLVHYPNGLTFKGSWRNGRHFNGKLYDDDGFVHYRFTNGKERNE